MKHKNEEGFGVVIAVILLALVAVGVGGFVAYKKMHRASTAMTSTTTSGSTNSTGSPRTQPPSPTATPVVQMAPTTGNTDADLDKDTTDVSTKLNALNSDSVSIDQGLNDQQGNLSEQ